MSEQQDRQLKKFLEKISVFNDKDLVESCLEKTENDYRSGDVGEYLYKQLLNAEHPKFSHKNIELVHVTLQAWNMNSRAAKLKDLASFEKTINKNRADFLELEHDRIEFIGDKRHEQLLSTLEKLFYGLQDTCEQNAKLVTVAKTLHFFLPRLAVPIDRKYTLSFFRGHNLKPDSAEYVPKELHQQWRLYKNIFLSFFELAKMHDFENYKDNRWGANTPKSLDNLVIGYQLLNR